MSSSPSIASRAGDDVEKNIVSCMSVFLIRAVFLIFSSASIMSFFNFKLLHLCLSFGISIHDNRTVCQKFLGQPMYA